MSKSVIVHILRRGLRLQSVRRAAFDAGIFGRVPWVQSSWGDPRSLKSSRYLARSPWTSAPVAKKQIGRLAFWTAAGRQARDDTLSPATGCLLLRDSVLAPTPSSADASPGEDGLPILSKEPIRRQRWAGPTTRATPRLEPRTSRGGAHDERVTSPPRPRTPARGARKNPRTPGARRRRARARRGATTTPTANLGGGNASPMMMMAARRRSR